MFQKKLRMIRDGGFSEDDAKRLYSDAAVITLENLFNTAADLLILHKLTSERKARIQRASKESAVLLLPDAPKKTRIKAWIIHHFWLAVVPLAYIRELYLKFLH